MKIIKNMMFLTILLLFSCSELDREYYDTKENYNLVNQKAQQFANHMDRKNYEVDFDWRNYYKILKKDKKVVDGKKGYFFKVAIPYFITDENLKSLLKKIAFFHKKELTFIKVEVLSAGIEDLSNVFATYRYETKDKKNSESIIFYENYTSKENLIKKGIKHYLLKYDYSILLSYQEMKRKYRSRSRAYIIESLSKTYGVSKPYVSKLLKFTKLYFKHL